MPLTFEQFEKLVRFLHARNQADAEYLHPLPSQLSEVLATNPLTESLYSQVALLSETVFGELWHDVQWFLFDWKPGFCIEITATATNPKRSYTIQSIEDYLSYAKAELFP